MKRVMVDIEALSSRPNACLLQVGAVYFTPQTDGTTCTIGERFNLYVNPVDSELNGGHVSPSTVSLVAETKSGSPPVNV